MFLKRITRKRISRFISATNKTRKILSAGVTRNNEMCYQSQWPTAQPLEIF